MVVVSRAQRGSFAESAHFAGYCDGKVFSGGGRQGLRVGIHRGRLYAHRYRKWAESSPDRTGYNLSRH